ncbi:MAG: hypothetical protein HUN04_13905 [Desulfobacter sp.]|nr:MAG: hypothetical protein HUN04_13905 [Desulfobacter sp.]
MRFFPIKIAILCLLLTPVFYIVTLAGCDHALEKSYTRKIQNIFIGNADDLLNGRMPLEEQVAKNIQNFLDQDFLTARAGLNLDIRIITAKGKIIYPIYIGTDFPAASPAVQYDAQLIADKNLKILNEDLQVKISLNLDHGALIANIILAFYSTLSLSLFFIFYKRGARKALHARKTQDALISDLKKEEKHHEKILKDLSEERQGLFKNISELNKKYQKSQKKAKINEEEMFKEILSLEDQLNSFIMMKKEKDEEITELKTTLEKYERRKSGKSKRNEFEFLSKRLTALYKNVNMNRKALTGFIGLTDEQQIKAEETIHHLDRDPDSVIIKRKVFSGKKHKSTCFEVLFAYNGRLYFKKEKNRTEVVVIGTKNTQNKDMEFLQNL